MSMHRSTAIVAATVLAATPLLAQDIPDDTKIIALPEWRYDDLYSEGMSADNFIDRPVYGENGEEIGEIEDIVIGSDGKVVSIVAEVGGFWDIGDTHVSIPLDQVDTSAGDRVIVPVTEETVDDYDFWGDETVPAENPETEVIEGVDDAPIPRAWRVSELIGDRARLDREADRVEYGYVSDVILRNGEVAAVVVQPRRLYGPGYRAYPYYGYERGWDAGTPYYDMPYTEDEVGNMEEFDYDRIDN